MNITRRTLAKVAAMLTLSGAIPVVAKSAPKFQPAPPPHPMPQMIGLMHYVEPNTVFNDDVTLPYGYWATSYVDDLTEIPQWGDTFSHWPDLGTDGTPTPDQQAEINHRSYTWALNDMMTEFVYGEQRYIRHRDGSLIDLGRDNQMA